MKTETIVKINSEDFNLPHGPSYGIDRGNVGAYGRFSWYYCRETFANRLRANKEFYYKCQPSLRNNIRKFIERIQDQMKIPTKNRVKIYLTNNENVLAIKLSRWWATKWRCSLLTILLRAGTRYTGRNFKTVFREQPYLAATKSAVKLFIEQGYTDTKKRLTGGWVNRFRFHNEAKVKEILCKPVCRKAKV